MFGFFARWARAGVLTRILDELRGRIRDGRGYCPNPVAITLDSQTVRAAETVSKQSRGWDHAKRTNGRNATWPATWADYP